MQGSVPDDVRWVETGEALERTLDDFERPRIAIAAVQAHVPGRELKFYAVRGNSTFFHCQAADGVPADPSDAVTARALAADISTALDLKIFGGDIVIGPDLVPNPHRRQSLAVVRALSRSGGGALRLANIWRRDLGT